MEQANEYKRGAEDMLSAIESAGGRIDWEALTAYSQSAYDLAVRGFGADSHQAARALARKNAAFAVRNKTMGQEVYSDPLPSRIAHFQRA